MERLYVDNAGTSCPKPDEVMDAMAAYAADCGTSAGRGAYAEAKACEQIICTCRRRIAALINAEGPQRIIFAMNCSEALAIAIHGMLNDAPAGTHVIATAMEHNSVLRPLHTLKERNGLDPQFIPCDPVTGVVNPADIHKAIRPETKLIACIHASNVTGTIQPVEEVCRIANQAGVPVIIDVSQSVGHMPIDVQALGADFMAMPGHKGLLGPLGTGVLYIRPGMEKHCRTIKEGGTGSVSELLTQPETMPDKYEVGSHNAIGIAGLSAAINWILEQGIDTLQRHDRRLSELFMQLTDGVENLRVYGPRDATKRVAAFSVNIAGLDPRQLAGLLEGQYGVLTRPGLHCAPLAHKTIGTFPAGTCRISFGPFNTEQHVQYVADALAGIAMQAAGGTWSSDSTASQPAHAPLTAQPQ